ncbi:MAG: zinc-binding alcohol dehydrogenase family protein [Proteobacteria bacterium]|nr:zinc-binding alcohol dehydrogenase family protein [Pseudomonadota bacterium]
MGTFDADEFGYMKGAHGYDSPNTVGFLAKTTKLHVSTLHKLPENSRFSLRQWAAFSLRYLTAWSNWHVALGALRLQLSEQDLPVPHVWGWGGGTTLAELSLARLQGCAATMITGSHVEAIQAKGITALDRHKLGILDFDERRFGTEDDYRQQYLAGEKQFLREVKAITGRGVSIFVDLIGSPVHRMTLKSLARQAVITTAGWKLGMLTPVNRAVECLSRHVHVFTHYVRASEAAPAIAFAELHGWMPEDRSPVYRWDDIPTLVTDYRDNKIASYYPLFEVAAP